MPDTSDRTITARCHCGFFSASFSVPSSSFPLKASICHCDDCRYSSGMVFGTFAVVPLPASLPFPQPPHPSYADLTGYHSSTNLVRYFCPNCGATVGNCEQDEWEIAVGLIESVDGNEEIQGLLDRVQMFVGSTGDGGAAVWVDGEKYGRKHRHRQSRDMTPEELELMATSTDPRHRDTASSEKLHARCHCGSVDFYVKRAKRGRGYYSADSGSPNYASFSYAVGAQDRASSELEKMEAALCTCPSCRRATGSEYVAWAFVMPDSISTADGRPFGPADPALGTYGSSPGAHRDFCKTCGAKVFFRKDVRSPQMYNVAPGLFRDVHVRNDAFFWWFMATGFVKKFAKDQELAQCILDGFEARKSLYVRDVK